jgi:spoIIIJ-associated protein
VEAKLEVVDDKENQAIMVQIETEDSGVLIGFHGETLASFQLLLSIIASREMAEWSRIIVNVGDYRQKREEVLRHMGLNAAQKVRFSGESVSLPGLSASDRRVVHLVLSEYNDVVAESEGEGKDRHLVIKPNKAA